MSSQQGLLEQLGLSGYASTIYETLLEEEYNSVSSLERKTQLHRPQVYDALHELEDKNLTHTIVHGKRKQYSAVSPSKLEEIFLQKEKLFLNHVDELHKKYDQSRSHKPEVVFSEGREAISKTYMDIAHDLKKDDKYYRYMPVSRMYRSKYIPKGYREVRDKRGLERRIITSKHTMHAKSNHLTRSVKAIPESVDLFEYEMSLTLYNDKVVLVDFETESVIEIKHDRFAQFQKKLFKLLFSRL